MWKTRCPAIINTRYLSTLASSQPALLTVSPRVLQRQQQQNSKNQRSNQRRQRKGNFIDLIYARSQGGRGGDGSVHFAREPFKDTAPPDVCNIYTHINAYNQL